MKPPALKQVGKTWYARMTIEGKQREYSMKTGDKTVALSRAKRMVKTAADYDLETALRQLRGGKLPTKRGTPTVEEVCKLYRQFCKEEGKPREVTVNTNARTLQNVAEAIGVKTVGGLTFDKIRAYKAEYVEQRGGSDKVKTTWDSILRKCKSVFKKSALAYYQSKGLAIEKSPFEGQATFGVKLQVYKALDAKKLLEMNKGYSALPAAQQMMYLLALCCGMRRNEVDKSRTSWFVDNGNGYDLQIQAEADFNTKAGQDRINPLDTNIYKRLMDLRKTAIQEQIELLEQTRKYSKEMSAKLKKALTAAPYLIPNSKPDCEIKKDAYRLGRRWEELRLWLKKHGCKEYHDLRAEYCVGLLRQGHEIGLVSRMMGHATTAVTLKYYAAYVSKPKASLPFVG